MINSRVLFTYINDGITYNFMAKNNQIYLYLIVYSIFDSDI